uniref:Uncharacterized protein n=1 Tax=Oryza sativa subsp. japonica TaxID=39947 RepID=Q339S9_ORYSJ|nr:hypothetical protein LOC_Os10g18750 [Oryza sativa Japonica Group]
MTKHKKAYHIFIIGPFAQVNNLVPYRRTPGILTGQKRRWLPVRPACVERSERPARGDSMPRESICGDGPGVGLVRTEENPNKPHVILPIPLSSSDAVPNCSIEPSSPKEY